MRAFLPERSDRPASRDTETEDRIELSPGSKATSSSVIADCPQLRLSTQRVRDNKLPAASQTACVTLDLHANAVAGHFLGHGGEISHVSSLPSRRPDAFMTACGDGVVRVYDSRSPLPNISVASVCEDMGGAAHANVNGVEFVFTGGGRSQSIRCFDLRAQTPLYELSTGNLEIRGLQFDQPTSTLYALGEGVPGEGREYCRIRDGSTATGRRLRSDSMALDSDGEQTEDEDSDGDDAASSSSLDHPRWPADSPHRPDAFGCLFDAGEHRLCAPWLSERSPDASSGLPLHAERRPGGLAAVRRRDARTRPLRLLDASVRSAHCISLVPTPDPQRAAELDRPRSVFLSLRGVCSRARVCSSFCPASTRCERPTRPSTRRPRPHRSRCQPASPFRSRPTPSRTT